MSQLAGLLIFALAARVLPQNPAGAGQDVTGLVFLDANGNGTRDPSERGLAGIAVSNQVEVVVTGALASPTVCMRYRPGRSWDSGSLMPAAA